MQLRILFVLSLFLLLIPPVEAQKKKTEKIADEETFIQENFRIKVPSRWKPGERFIYVDSVLNITLKPERPVLHDTTNYLNMPFVFEAFKERTDWGGNSTLDLIFRANGQQYRFETGKSLTQISDTTYNPLIPGLIWLPEIEKADSLLKGKTFYILTSEWMAEDEASLRNARKFVPVVITAVEPGNEYAPVNIRFQDQTGAEFYIRTTLSGTLNSSSRYKFPRIFSFHDPRTKYKEIADETWKLITEGKLAVGMTQSEVRLSIGKPTNIDRIPTYSGLREQWLYNSGTMIQFQDGRITNFRQ